MSRCPGPLRCPRFLGCPSPWSSQTRENPLTSKMFPQKIFPLQTSQQPPAVAMLWQHHPHRVPPAQIPLSAIGPACSAPPVQGLTPIQIPRGRTLTSPEPWGRAGVAGMLAGPARH